MRGDTVHFILKGKYYDQIDRGEKTVEYRENTPYWRSHIANKLYVIFHRGYTKVTMKFKIAKVIVPRKINRPIEVHLGKRLKSN